jgi:hypothetical protein
MGTPTYCRTCGQKLPEWIDIADALEETLRDAGNIPPGLRPMLLQAISELRELRHRELDRAAV